MGEVKDCTTLYCSEYKSKDTSSDKKILPFKSLDNIQDILLSDSMARKEGCIAFDEYIQHIR